MAASPFPRTVGVVGLGLMGASLARAVRAADPGVRLVAVEPREDVRAQALADGVADEARAAPDVALEACELAVLCTPVAAIEALLGPVSRLLPDGAVLTDVGGAKAHVVAAARASVRPGVAFVGAHPMFGGHGGYAGASAEKWKGGTVAVCTDAAPAEAPDAVERVVALHLALGARVERCTAAEHDAAVAMVSHLPYLVASALAVAAREAGPLAVRLAGPGLKDMTRLAAFPFDIQGEVARRNAGLPEAAARLERHLARLLAAIAESPEAARSALEAARAAREEIF
ncbi:prephenate dehydrogenase [Anaeromyxobacter sp. Fw109-5]|uniref:prephenate dehydrogenase n=1 Tax=Anaeromyxobacter sp. (strain Fw109-5) TaxID=404589 RepID=UPI0000ED78D3|nr:prephenate dehydrogenase [Anaeromyxobacter sp. Fw109-5]ABS24421.1 Prephenate dehydrogenase [Anaeromyxobacter sp. Fw109-5]